MGINNVALKTFSSTGSQSVCRANVADSSKMVESQFITKCKNEYINGSGITSIAGQSFTLSSGTVPATEEFRVANDCDAISEMTLQMSVTLPPFALGVFSRIHSKTFLLDLINKIELYMGGILIQTIRPADIYVRNSTELNSLVNYNQPLWTNIAPSNAGIFYTTVGTSPAHTLDFAVSIPFAGRDKKMQRSFLNAGAYTNSLVVKVKYNTYTVSSNLLGTSNFSITANVVVDPESSPIVSTSLLVFTHNITETEKNFIQSNIINRIINTSQSIVTTLTSTTTPSSPKISINLRDISINVSHLLISLNHPLFKPSEGTYVGGVGVSATVTGIGYVNGSASLVDLGSMWSEIIKIGNGTGGMANVGVPTGWLKSAELIIGSDRTGEVSGSSLLANNLEGFGLNYIDAKGIYIFKTAETAFSTAGISFSKCNSVQLVLTLNDAYITAMTAIFNLGIVGPVISVTACGTQVQTTVGGSISLSG